MLFRSMLTALAVLQHNDQRLPEYRVELYESILGWLAAAHEHKEGRLPAQKCLEYMRKLALRMQDEPAGRLVQVNKRSAAELFTREFGGSVDANEELLERETQDSGIIAAVGSDLKFWHLSFQEYLAAREIASLSDQEQIQRVVKSGKLYQPEWRETMRLLGSVLRQIGPDKIDGLIDAILPGDRPALADQVRCAALLSAMMRDLSRMKYKPKNPAYEPAVRKVMGIFDAGAAEEIEIGKRAEAADLLGQVGDPRLDEDNWVTIPAGSFLMGAQKSKKSDPNYDQEALNSEAPVHEVQLKGFRIRRFPVTVQEFAEFINKDGSPRHWLEGFGKFTEPEGWKTQTQFPNRPVTGVSWFEAAAYCAWKKWRLPTGAEWERAARGPQCTRYPWGNEPPLDASRANYGGNIGHVTPVGLFPKGNSSEGLCDMLGNVWEWCGDWVAPYETRHSQNMEEKYRVLRGGAWFNNPVLVRVSVRYGLVPSNRYVVGFRCAGELS